MSSGLTMLLCAAALALLSAPARAQPCPGDCDADGATSDADAARALRAVFDPAGGDCAAADLDGNGDVTAAELLRIRVAVVDPPPGCGLVPTSSATASATSTATASPTPTASTTATPTNTPSPQATPTGTRTASASVSPTPTRTSPPSSATPASTWIPLTPLPGGPRQEIGVTALDGRVYVIGGFGGADVVEVYDTSTNQWDRVADLPSGRNHIGTAALGGLVYVVGGFVGNGFTPASEVFRYDPGEDEWSTVAALPQPRGALALVELDGRLYASGGSGPVESVSDHAAYDPDANMWTPLAPLPSPARNHLAAVALDGFVYVVGGRRDGGGNINSAQLDRYDPDTNSWEPLASMPTARSGHAAAAIAGRIVVMGGEVNAANPPNNVFVEVEVYSPGTNTWVSLDPMADPRHGIGAATVGDLIYVPGGARRAGFGATEAADALRIIF